MSRVSGESGYDRSAVATMAYFERNWASESGIDRSELPAMFKHALIYSPEPTDYSFGLSLETLVHAMEDADRCEDHDIATDRKSLSGAALFLDAHPRGGTAPQLFRHQAGQFGFNQQESDTAALLIEEAQPGNTPRSINGKILVRSRLHQLGADYETAFEPSVTAPGEIQKGQGQIVKVGSESHANGQEITDSVKAQTAEKLATLLQNDLSYGEFDVRQYEMWRSKAWGNILALGTSITDSGLRGQLAAPISGMAINTLIQGIDQYSGNEG